MRVRFGGEAPGARLAFSALDRLEQHEILYHILRAMKSGPSPLITAARTLAATRKALVSKVELKQVEQVIKQVPRRNCRSRPSRSFEENTPLFSQEMQASCCGCRRLSSLEKGLRDAEHLTPAWSASPGDYRKGANCRA